MIGLVQFRCHESSPVGERSLRWEGFVEKVGRFWAWTERVKEWWMRRVVMIIQRRADKWMRRWVKTWLAKLTEWIRDLIPETGWCISEWAICDFQWGDGRWARKSDNRWGAGTARGLNRDQIVKMARLTGCKNFVGKRKKFIFNAFVDLKPVERFDYGSDMWGFMSTSKRVLDLLEESEKRVHEKN